MECLDVDDLWTDVRRSRRYDTVVHRCRRWLDAFWPQAYGLGLAPKWTKNAGRAMPPPRIVVTPQIGMRYIGTYYPSFHSKGPAIRIPPREGFVHRIREGDRPWPLLADLRETLLHELVHAMDDRSGRLVAKIDNDDPHDDGFWECLSNLLDAFPTSTL